MTEADPSALASWVQDMHDVSEIECHARGPRMGGRGVGGGVTDEARSIKEESTAHKRGMEGKQVD